MATRMGWFGATVLLRLRRLDRVVAVAPLLQFGLEAERRQDRPDQVADAFAVLGGDGDRLAEAELEGFVEAVGAGPPFALVGDQDGRHA